ncbi:MAG: flagellar motor protein MotB [Thermodesulfobacteriota bacterium]
MARKGKKEAADGGIPAWLVTFTDMMTLMLTFFVLLVSMATIDERRKLITLGSIIGTFGTGKSFDNLSVKDRRRSVEPGPMDLDKIDDLTPLKDKAWENAYEDLDFAANKFVQIFTINEDVLFEPGSTEIKPEGRRMLESTLPVLLQIDYPLLLAGHTSTLREEQGAGYKVERRTEGSDPSWRLSLGRTMSVYRFLLESGVPHDRLRMEAFGRFRPRFGDLTAADRRRNRRVDIVLDKRNGEWLKKIEKPAEPREEGPYQYKDFRFRLEESAPQREDISPLLSPLRSRIREGKR